MKFSRYLLIGLLFLTAACQNTVTPTPALNVPPTVPTPQPGQVTVTGRLFEMGSTKPLANTAVRLAKVYVEIEPPIWIDDPLAPGAVTDASGYFVITNIIPDPTRPLTDVQAFAVGLQESSYGIVENPQKPDDALMITLTANSLINVGDVYVNLR